VIKILLRGRVCVSLYMGNCQGGTTLGRNHLWIVLVVPRFVGSDWTISGEVVFPVRESGGGAPFLCLSVVGGSPFPFFSSLS